MFIRRVLFAVWKRAFAVCLRHTLNGPNPVVVVMDLSNGLLIQLGCYIFLALNSIRLEPDLLII